MDHRTTLLWMVLATGILLRPTNAQFAQTLPAGLEAVDGNASTGFPFGTASTHIWHWIYDAANFSATGPIVITSLAIRPDAGTVTTSAAFQNVEIRMASATVDWATTFPNAQTFSSNVGPDVTTVFSGAVTIPSGLTGGPTAWIPIPVSPFTFDPSAGNDFIIQVRTPGPGNAFAMTTDGHNNGNSTRYGHTSIATSPTSNFSNLAFVPVVRIEYHPAVGLFPDFLATPTSGTAPLSVTFQDTSYTSAFGGLQSWAWDFDGDSVVDSLVQNPTFTYLVPGTYSVTLTVTDAAANQSSHTKQAFVAVGQYPFTVATSGGGAGDLVVTPVPPAGAPTATLGFTLVSFTPPPSVGTGVLFGILPDAATFFVLGNLPTVGNPLAYVVAPGFYPSVPFSVGPGAFSNLAGTTADFVQVGLTPGFQLVFSTPVQRVTF